MKTRTGWIQGGWVRLLLWPALALACLAVEGQKAGAPNPGAVDGVDVLFQNALVQEEGRRDYPAAIRQYEAVIQELDGRRRLAAAAVYRLGECYRKLGRTNEAVAQYERLLREFAADESLVRLSRQNLAGLGRDGTGTSPRLAGGAAGSSVAAGSTLEELGAALRAIDARQGDPEAQARIALGFFPDEGLRKMLLHVPLVRRQSESFASNPEQRPTSMVVPLQGDGRVEIDLAGNAPLDRERAARLLADQLRYLQERVDFVVGVQRARLGALQAARGELDPTRQLAAQIAAVRAAKTPEAGAAAVREFFGTAGLDELQHEIRDQERKIVELRVDFAEGHPEMVKAAAALKSLQQKLRQEVSDVLAAQEARLAIGQGDLPSSPASSSSARLGAEGAATNEEAEEIRRIRALVANSPDLINALSPEGGTPLGKAASKGQLAVARFLLDHGARTEVRSKDGSTPLHGPVMAGHKAMVELLLDQGASILARTANGLNATALHLAAQRGFVTMAEVLLARGAEIQAVAVSSVAAYEGTPLYSAVQADCLEVAQLLLSKGADPNLRAEGKLPPLVVAVSAEMVGLLLAHKADPKLDGGQRLVSAVHAGDLSIVKMLLDAGAAVEADAGRERAGPLPVAVELRRRDMAELLLARGAAINRIQPGAGLSPFHRMVASLDLDWLDWGLKHGGDPNVRTAAGETALEVAGVLRNPAVRAPGPRGEEEAGADLTWKKAERLLVHGARPDEPFLFQQGTLVHAVAYLGGTQALGWLVSAKANLNARAERGLTPLIVAACRGDVPMVEALIKAGAEVNGTNDLGATALHYAAARHLAPVVAKLVEAKADPARKDSQGRTAEMFVGGQVLSQAGPFGVQDMGQLGTRLPAFPSVGGMGPRTDLAELRRWLPRAEAKLLPPVARAGKVVVFGALNGVIALEAYKPTTVAEALLTLHPGATANLRKVRVHRAPEREGTPGVVETLNVEELLRTNDRERDLVLQPGDRIEVSEKLL